MAGRYSHALEIVRSVRPLLLPQFGKEKVSAYKTERYDSPVTQLDKDVEAHLAQELYLRYPGISFVGEERGGDRSADAFWLVDPIDGTKAFMRGLPFCTTMLALIEEGKPVFSAIFDFVNDELYHAESGKGAYRNDERIFVSTRTAREALVGLESRLAGPESKAARTSLEKRYKMFKTRTAGHEFALVASGKVEGRICYDPFGEDYDFAPGALLVSEAGGIVANMGSASYDYRDLNFIAANPSLFKALTTGPEAIFPISQNSATV